MPHTLTRENFNYIFQYLQKEEIILSKSDFIFEFESHSEFPSMLAISDTLTFFEIKNAALKVSASEIIELPECFLTVLRDGESHPKYHFIEKIEEDYFCISEGGSSKMSLLELQSRWLNVVLLAEKNNQQKKTESKNFFNALLATIIGICISAFLFKSDSRAAEKVFILLPAAGIVFSVISLKSLFEIKSSIVNRFCSSGASIDCDAVTASSKWRLFRTLDLSTLSIVFFTFQLLAFFPFLLLKQTNSYFSIQEILLFSSIPLILASVFYQKFTVRKWCPICLAIITILLFEISWIFHLDFQTNVNFEAVSLCALTGASLLLLWNAIKRMLTKLKRLKESEIKSNRFQRNYHLFRSALLTQKKIQSPSESLILGNDDSPLDILLVLSLKCPHCQTAYTILKNQLNKYESIKLNIIFKCDWENESENIRKVYLSLLSIYASEGEYRFTKALDNWFEISNADLWLKKYNVINFDIGHADLLKSHYSSCFHAKVTQTPSVYIMGYEYPNIYDIENIEFFINDLLEDNL